MKKALTSKTFWGILLTILQCILKNHGVDIPTDFQLVTGGLAAYGFRDAIDKVKSN